MRTALRASTLAPPAAAASASAAASSGRGRPPKAVTVEDFAAQVID